MTYLRFVGYVLLHRLLLGHPIWRILKGQQIRPFLTMLLTANWEETQFGLLNGGTTTVPPGGLIATQEEIAAIARVGRQVVRTAIQKMPRFSSLAILQLWSRVMVQEFPATVFGNQTLKRRSSD